MPKSISCLGLWFMIYDREFYSKFNAHVTAGSTAGSVAGFAMSSLWSGPSLGVLVLRLARAHTGFRLLSPAAFIALCFRVDIHREKKTLKLCFLFKGKRDVKWDQWGVISIEQWWYHLQILQRCNAPSNSGLEGELVVELIANTCSRRSQVLQRGACERRSNIFLHFAFTGPYR